MIKDLSIPKEIQEKLAIIEKEMDFSKEISPPDKKLIIAGVVLCLASIIISINNKNFFEPALFLVVGIITIAIYIDYTKFYKLYSNARDIIDYYRKRESKIGT